MADDNQPRVATVRSIPGETHLTITLSVAGRLRNLERPKDELLERPLSRLLANLHGGGKKKQRLPDKAAPAVAGSDPADELTAPARAGIEAADGLLLDAQKEANDEAWASGRTLVLGAARYAIVRNPPSVQRLEIYGRAFAGVPVVPRASLLFAEEDACVWRWERRREGAANWEAIDGAGTRLYTPSADDIGAHLRVRCRAAMVGPDTELVLGDEAVSQATGPVGPCPQLERPWLPSAASKPATALRLVTYNILADQYAATDRAKKVLFAHCPAEYLDSARRRPHVLGQLSCLGADILCLQEVDASMYDNVLAPGLESEFAGSYLNKDGAVREGEALFWRADRLRPIARRELSLRRAFAQTEGGALDARVRAYLERRPALRHALSKVGTVAQLVALETRDDRLPPATLIVVNTHLFYHSNAPHIRTLHTWAIMREAKAFAEQLRAERGTSPTLVLCGDLNSDLNDGVPGNLELLLSGRVGAGYWDWEYVSRFAWGRGDEDGEEGQEGAQEGAAAGAGDGADAASDPGLELRVDWPGPLRAAGDLRPPWSNYVRGYQGLLDYIWYDPRVLAWRPSAASRAAERLTPEDVGGFLPNATAPSDHIPLVYDLEFCQSKDDEERRTTENGSDAATAATPAALWAVREAAAHLAAGSVIAVPTDTLYGLAASAQSAEGVARIYVAKGRRESKPLAVAVSDVDKISVYCRTEHLPAGLLDALLPGAVTVVLPVRPGAPLARELNRGSTALGVRVPDHAFVRALARQLGGALALTSANRSGGRSSVDVDEFQDLWPACAAVYDGGCLKKGRAGSTVVDLSEPGRFHISRDGVAVDDVRRTLAQHGLIAQ